MSAYIIIPTICITNYPFYLFYFVKAISCIPLSRNTLLSADSGHPEHVTSDIPVGQFLRLRRICSDEGEFQQEKKDYITGLVTEANRANTLRRAINIAEEGFY